MKVARLNKSSTNIQKCLISDSEFLKENHSRYCIISENDFKILVKIGLHKTKNVAETIFVDTSVCLHTSFRTILKHNQIRKISLDKCEILTPPSIVKTADVIVIFDDIFSIKAFKSSPILPQIIKEILKLYVICNNSVIFLDNLPSNQRFGIYCIIITEIEGVSKNKIFKTNSRSNIYLEKCLCKLQLEQVQERENQIEIKGCQRVYDIIKEAIEFAKKFGKINIKVVKKLLLVGPSGCGKTTLIHNLAYEHECVVLEILPSDINSLVVKDLEKKLNDVYDKAKIYSENQVCCIILIEDIDLMSVGKTSHSKQFVKQLINLLEKLEDVPGVIVVATSNSPELIDSQLRKPKRLEDELEIMIPTEKEREEIIKSILKYCKIEWNTDLISQITKWTPGFVGADLRLLILETKMLMKKHQENNNCAESVAYQNALKQALTKVIPSALRGTLGLFTTKDTLFSNLGGLESIKKILDLSIKQQLNNPEKFKKLGIPLTKGILLYGPPGCAKTSLVKALAKECNTTFLATSAADLYSPFVGDAEKKIIQLFAQARIGSPSILFIDEIDAIVGSKTGDRERGVQERILSTLLVEMDGVGLKVNTQRNSLDVPEAGENEKASSENQISHGVIVIGATNRPQLLDDALKRPGRFDRLLYIPPPDENERFEILKKLTEKMPLHSSVDLKLLAKLTNFYSGADLKNLCQESGLYALKSSNMSADCVHQSHFEFIYREYRPSLNEKVVGFYESYQKYNL